MMYSGSDSPPVSVVARARSCQALLSNYVGSLVKLGYASDGYEIR